MRATRDLTEIQSNRAAHRPVPKNKFTQPGVPAPAC